MPRPSWEVPVVGEFDVVCVARGVHGPFKDDEHPDDRSKDRSYPYSTLAAQDGSGSANATHAPELELELELFKPYRVLIDVRAQGKLRLMGLAPERAAEKAPPVKAVA
jgi:hypothetical protein